MVTFALMNAFLAVSEYFFFAPAANILDPRFKEFIALLAFKREEAFLLPSLSDFISPFGSICADVLAVRGDPAPFAALAILSRDST